jgi:hypothetical protein
VALDIDQREKIRKVRYLADQEFNAQKEKQGHQESLENSIVLMSCS